MSIGRLNNEAVVLPGGEKWEKDLHSELIIHTVASNTYYNRELFDTKRCEQNLCVKWEYEFPKIDK